MADTAFTRLPGERVELRRFTEADLQAFVAYRSFPAVARYQTWDAPYPAERGAAFIRQMMAQHPDTPGEGFQFGVTLRAAGELIGDIAACPETHDPRQVQIGFTFAPAHQGHGYATEAVRVLLGYLFGARGKHRVSAGCDARNSASARLMERVGMRREGHQRESAWAKGEWTDDLLYAILEWRALT